MPRRGRRSEAAKIRWRRMDPEPDIAKLTTPQPTPQAWSPTQSPEKKKPLLMAFGPPDQTCPMVCQEELRGPSTPLGSRQGTGYRHRVMQWGYSRVTRRRRKFVLLAEAPEKKFALLVGDSHLRAIVDGFVTMPGSTLSLGVLSSPGASADELRREVLDTILPRTPDVICLLAPSNNLSSSTTFQEAGRDFDSLLHTISNLCANVVVLDFPPRLIVEEREQALLRQEYSRVAAKRSVRYLPVTEHFPLSHLDMWSRDGVHLSDAPGMEVLAKLLWGAVSTQLQLSAPVSESLALSAFPPLSACPPVSLPAFPPISLPACPPVSHPFPRLVVDGEGPGQSASHTFHGTVVGGGQKASVLEPCVSGPPVLSEGYTFPSRQKI
ncbi:uncharacterized protein V3H82_021097 [Fundulus diaphanus]